MLSSQRKLMWSVSVNVWYILGLQSIVSILIVTYYPCPVVVWCDCVGDLQWRKDPLPCRGPTLPHPAAERGAETRETSQCSLCH